MYIYICIYIEEDDHDPLLAEALKVRICMYDGYVYVSMYGYA